MAAFSWRGATRDRLPPTTHAFPDRDRSGPSSPVGTPLVAAAGAGDGWWSSFVGLMRRTAESAPSLPRSRSRELGVNDEEEGPTSPRRAWRQAAEVLQPQLCKLLLLLGVLLSLLLVAGLLMPSARGHGKEMPPAMPAPAPGQPMPACAGEVPCPAAWSNGGGGGFFCPETNGCQAGAEGPFPDCPRQCHIGGLYRGPTAEPVLGNTGASAAGEAAEAGRPAETGRPSTAKPVLPQKLTGPGNFDLRIVKDGHLLGCAAPIGLFPGHPKYGCSGDFSTAETCDAASHPVKDTKYVAAVHAGCETEEGRGTYGYAYDDGVGLKQCSPLAKYEWVLCPTGTEGPILWDVEPGLGEDSTRRFRVTNKCSGAVWIQQAGTEEEMMPHEKGTVRIDPMASYTYSIPNRGLPSTRFLPKTGCDNTGNNCEVQSMPPCPSQGCDLPVDTKFEASWGCKYARAIPEQDKLHCAVTGQGNPSTYQDWWDGSAVDGWTLPFSVLVDDGGHGLVPGGGGGSPSICGNVVCANLIAAKLCPRDEFLTPAS